jgi:hypothetical protein
VIKVRKERKLQDKAKEKEDKRKAKEQQKKSVDSTKKAKAAATTAKNRERKQRRAKPPVEAKRVRERGTQGDQDPWGPRTKQAKTCPESDRATEAEGAETGKPNKQQTVIEQIYNHVNRTKSINSKCIGESQGATNMRNTEVRNINKGICAKGDG